MIVKEVSKERQLDKYSINSLAEASTKRDELVVLIFNETACKTNELIDIKTKDFLENKIRIKDRIISITEELRIKIKDHITSSKLQSENYLFSSRQSEKITPKRVRQIIQKKSSEILGFKINPKDIRKASIKNKIKFENVEEVKKQVGLKRFDKREFLSKDKIKNIEEKISDKRTKLLFHLLLNGLKSKTITQIKVKEANKLKLDDKIKKELKKHILENKLSKNDPLFLTRQNSSLTKERIFQLISSIGEENRIELSPRLLNNTSIAIALENDDKDKLNNIGVRKVSFHLHGGFIKNE